MDHTKVFLPPNSSQTKQTANNMKDQFKMTNYITSKTSVCMQACVHAGYCMCLLVCLQLT